MAADEKRVSPEQVVRAIRRQTRRKFSAAIINVSSRMLIKRKPVHCDFILPARLQTESGSRCGWNGRISGES